MKATTCPKTVVGGKQGTCSLRNTLTPTKPLFVSVEFHGDHKTVTKLR